MSYQDLNKTAELGSSLLSYQDRETYMRTYKYRINLSSVYDHVIRLVAKPPTRKFTLLEFTVFY